MIWIIGMGGSLGAAARLLLGNFISKKARKRSPFPMGTWIINITGSFLFGLISQLYLSNDINDWIWFFGGAGFCGAFTTFSTFGIETINLIKLNKFKLAAIYVVASVIVGVIAVMLGLYI